MHLIYYCSGERNCWLFRFTNEKTCECVCVCLCLGFGGVAHFLYTLCIVACISIQNLYIILCIMYLCYYLALCGKCKVFRTHCSGYSFLFIHTLLLTANETFHSAIFEQFYCYRKANFLLLLLFHQVVSFLVSKSF